MTRASHTRVCTARAPYTNNGTTTITFKETIVKTIFEISILDSDIIMETLVSLQCGFV